MKKNTFLKTDFQVKPMSSLSVMCFCPTITLLISRLMRSINWLSLCILSFNSRISVSIIIDFFVFILICAKLTTICQFYCIPWNYFFLNSQNKSKVDLFWEFLLNLVRRIFFHLIHQFLATIENSTFYSADRQMQTVCDFFVFVTVVVHVKGTSEFFV